MLYRYSKHIKELIFVFVGCLILLGLACGTSDTRQRLVVDRDIVEEIAEDVADEVAREVIRRMELSPSQPVIVEKEVIKEVERPIIIEKEVIREIPVEVVVVKEVIKVVEVPVIVEKEVIREVIVEKIVRECGQ